MRKDCLHQAYTWYVKAEIVDGKLRIIIVGNCSICGKVEIESWKVER